jgi:RNA polymerase sigma factor (sigma-70 family)
VLGVARRQLADPQQAEDVFQATFLSLARSAARLGRQAPVANWLYTVALRQARKARVRAARRRDYEAAGARPPAPTADPLAEVSGRELLRAVDEELARLPEKYRLPVLLCCVQGLSREEAARQLGWSAGAVKGRLERGRQRLAARLAGRGLAPAALVLAPLAAAAVPASLCASASALGASPWSPALTASVLTLAAADKPRRLLALGVFGFLLAAGLTGLTLASGEKGPPPAAPAPRAAQPPAQRLDDPLPAGGTLRLGTSRYRHGTFIRNLSVSADGKLAAAGSGGHIHGSVRVYDLTTGRVRATVATEVSSDNEAVALSPDGRTLATVDGGTVRLCDATTGKKARTIAPPKPDTRTLTSWLLWSPDGKALALATPDGKGIRLLDVERGTVTRTLAHQNVVYAAAFSPDGKLLAAGGYDSAGGKYFGRIWEVATGKELRRFVNGQAALRTLAFAPDGKALAGGGDDGRLRAEAARGFAAQRRLLADTAGAVELLSAKIKPVEPVEAKHLARLVADLASPKFATRDEATRALRELGGRAVAALRETAEKAELLETRRRAGRLLAEFTEGPIPPEELRVLRAVEVLEWANTPAARRLLEAWARGAPGARLTGASADALRRLKSADKNREWGG